jgi:hypothetical protein
LDQEKWERQARMVKVYKDSKRHPRKQKTLVKTQFDSKMILFKKTLEFKDAINLCYSKQTIALQNKIPIP